SLLLALSSLPPMRLDLFLKLSRLCPRRTVAQKLCDADFVFLNGRPAKSAHEVKPGDEIAIRKPDEEIVSRVLTVPSNRNIPRRESHTLIEIICRKTFDVNPTTE